MFYAVTLTARDGLTDENILIIGEYFKQCRHAYLINEQGDSGSNSHVEGVVEFETDITSNISKRLKTLYVRLKIEVVKGITFRVRKATEYIGCIIYASKELQASGKLVLLKGWSQTWIDKAIKDNVKKIPHKMLAKAGTRVYQKTGPALIYEWCIANNMHIETKFQYLKVIRYMGNQNYMFGSTRHVGLFQDVCALFGDGGYCITF